MRSFSADSQLTSGTADEYAMVKGMHAPLTSLSHKWNRAVCQPHVIVKHQFLVSITVLDKCDRRCTIYEDTLVK